MRNELIYASMPGIPIHIKSPRPQNKGVICDLHYHDEIELLVIKHGRMSCTAGQQTLVLEPGELAFINSRIPHSTEVLEDKTVTCLLQINLTGIAASPANEYLLYFLNSGENPFILFPALTPDTARIIAHIDNICREFMLKEQAFGLYIKADTYAILAFLYRNGILIDIEDGSDRKSVDKVLPILQYIHKHYQEDITLERASSLLGLNPYYFCRLFKRATGKTFTEYLNFVRISAAERLLSDTKKSVTDVFLDVGFSSASYFNRVFRRLKSCSPTIYRKIKYSQE